MPTILPTHIQQILAQRPNARVLVLEVLEEDVEVTAQWLRNCGYKAGSDKANPVLVMTTRGFARHWRTLGPIDVVIVHNQYNMHRVDSGRSYRTCVTRINEQPQRVQWIVMEPTAPLGASPSEPITWQCGEPLVLACTPMEIRVPSPQPASCGSTNPRGTWYCHACGRFRGIEYGGFNDSRQNNQRN